MQNIKEVSSNIDLVMGSLIGHVRHHSDITFIIRSFEWSLDARSKAFVLYLKIMTGGRKLSVELPVQDTACVRLNSDNTAEMIPLSGSDTQQLIQEIDQGVATQISAGNVVDITKPDGVRDVETELDRLLGVPVNHNGVDFTLLSYEWSRGYPSERFTVIADVEIDGFPVTLNLENFSCPYADIVSDPFDIDVEPFKSNADAALFLKEFKDQVTA